MNLHLRYNDHISPGEVVCIVHLLDPAQQLPNVRVMGPDVGRLQVPRDQWDAFKATWLACGHTADWAFN